MKVIKCRRDGERCDLRGGRCRHLTAWGGKCFDRVEVDERHKAPEPKSKPWIKEPEEL